MVTAETVSSKQEERSTDDVDVASKQEERSTDDADDDVVHAKRPAREVAQDRRCLPTRP